MRFRSRDVHIVRILPMLSESSLVALRSGGVDFQTVMATARDVPEFGQEPKVNSRLWTRSKTFKNYI